MLLQDFMYQKSMVRDASYGSMQPMPTNALVDDVLACGSDYLSVVASVQSVRRYCRKKNGRRASAASHAQASSKMPELAIASKQKRRRFSILISVLSGAHVFQCFQMPWRLSISRFFEHQMADGRRWQDHPFFVWPQCVPPPHLFFCIQPLLCPCLPCLDQRRRSLGSSWRVLSAHTAARI